MHGNVRYPKLHDASWITEQLKTSTPGRIAKQLGASRPTVMSAIKKFGIEYIPRARESTWARSRTYKPQMRLGETQLRLLMEPYDPNDIPWEILKLHGEIKSWLYMNKEKLNP